MTDEQYTKALKFLLKRSLAEGRNSGNADDLLRSLMENPLPADFEEQTDTQDEADKQARIVKMRATLAELEKPTRR